MYSRLFLICCFALLFFGCAPKQISQKEEYSQALRTSQRFVQEYGAVSSKEAQLYLKSLSSRMQNSFPYPDHTFPSYNVTLLNTKTSLAFSPGAGFILLSRGLVLSLASEGELAFVLAHEMAHQELRHTALAELQEEGSLKDASQDTSTAGIHEDLEFDADRFAATILVRAGYDPSEATRAIYHAATYRDDLKTDPAALALLDARKKRLVEFLQKAKLQPFGVVLPQRDFLRLKELLRG